MRRFDHFDAMPTLLQSLDEEQRLRNTAACLETRRLLRAALHEWLPGQKVIVFGSLVDPPRFGPTSDVDIALEAPPDTMSIYALGSRLEERLHRKTDVVLLTETRLRESILRKGKTWIV